MTTSTPQTLEAHRERFSSFSSVSSEELDALGSELSAHEPPRKRGPSKKKKPHAAADHDDPRSSASTLTMTWITSVTRCTRESRKTR